MRSFIYRHQVLFAFATSFALLLAAAILTFVKLRDPVTLLVIHFDVFRGIDTLGTRDDALSLLVMAAGLVMINGLLARAFRDRAAIISYLFGYGSFLISILILIAVGVIVAVN